MSQVAVFKARKIITLNSYRPEATHVAIRDGRILGVGGPEILAAYPDARVDTQFAEMILTPGFVEGHCHVFEGRVWDLAYVGFHDRRDPDGRLWPGVRTLDAVIDRLCEIEARMDTPDEPLFAWGFDPIYFGTARLALHQLDRVSATRPVVLQHSNGHLLNVNSPVLRLTRISRETDVHGVAKDAYGNPTGELAEAAATYPVYRALGNPFFSDLTVRNIDRFAQAAVNAGVTTAADLMTQMSDAALDAFRTATSAERFPLRIVTALRSFDVPLDVGPQRLAELVGTGTEKLVFGMVKIMTDGSIQGFSARLKWPGYHNGAKNGVWNMEPSRIAEMILAYHKAGAHIHAHVNGDEASEIVLDAIEAALTAHPRPDHRHTLQHCQLADESQFRRMAAMGVCANLFANHIHYWGDQHYDITVGPDRAARMDACGTALRHGVPLAIHSDAPVTPLAPLFTAWCAVNRVTSSGKVLGPNERITVGEALHAITLGAAYTLKMDHLVGSIEPGKHADFAVLAEDPTRVAALELKDVPVWGTVIGGHVNQAATA